MAELIDIKAHRRPRPKETLSQHKVDTAQPRAARYSIHDASLPGFQLRVSPGGSRAYYLHTRIGKGRTARQAWIHIGDAAVLKLREAREKAKGMLVETRDGGDPVRRLAAEEQVFALLDRYEASLKARGVVRRSLVMRSLRAGLDRHRKDRLADLNRATFAGIMNGLDADGLPGAADYFRKSASAFLNWCVNNGRLHASPLAGYRREKITRRQLVTADRFTMKTAAEIRTFWDATARANPNLRDYLRFLLLTGQRRTETALMRWRDVDLDRGIWEIPAEHSKTGAAHTVYLAVESSDLLRSQPRYAGTELVFPGRNFTPMSGWSKMIEPVRKAFGNPALSLHALRRTYRTMLSEIGVNEDIAERQIAHKRRSLVGLYDKSHLVERRKDAQARYETHLAEIVR